MQLSIVKNELHFLGFISISLLLEIIFDEVTQ